MFHHTYKCGFEGKHEYSHIGQRFTCPVCREIHKIPDPSYKVVDSGGRNPANLSFFKSLLQWFVSLYQELQKELDSWFTVQPLPFPKRTSTSEYGKQQRRHGVTSSNTKKMLRDLATKAWKTSESLNVKPFVLDPPTLHSLKLEDGLRRMMIHAEKIAPGFEVPLYVPLLQYSSTPVSTAGQFRVDEDGYTFIEVDNRFLLDMKASYAILSHELCHYILEKIGIRETDKDKNERLTDVCMFVLGFGPLFLQGYKRELAQSSCNSGYRLGYLSDSDYEGLNALVLKLREQGSLHLPSRVNELESKILNRLRGNQSQFERYLRFWEEKHPEMTHLDRLEGILYDLER